MTRSLRILSALCLLGAAACGGSDEGMGDGTTPSGSRGDLSVREQCTGETRAVDVNNDGTPDIRHNYDGARLRCSEFDMNFDGRVDITRFYAPDGRTPLREEHDFDFDGRIDQISYYENGQLVRKELDTNFDNRIDTWMWCQGGLVARAERDRRNTGDPDTWEEYENGQLVSVRYDDNNDGTPEKWEIFREGRLVEVRFDTNADGRPDRAEEIPSDQAGPPDEPVRCDPLPLAEQEERRGDDREDAALEDDTVDTDVVEGDE